MILPFCSAMNPKSPGRCQPPRWLATSGTAFAASASVHSRHREKIPQYLDVILAAVRNHKIGHRTCSLFVKMHRQCEVGKVEMEDHDIRAALDRHWAASDANDFEAEHQIYREDAVLEYPQSGERIRGRRNIQASRAAQPNRKRFTVRRIIGACDLWVTEYILTYDERPSYTVSIMEFRDGKVARETQYFGDPFEPGPSRAQWVEQMR
jgi:SnoaL-like domain